jgi:phage repressor protein C with HTH and peptisase S24 domain
MENESVLAKTESRLKDAGLAGNAASPENILTRIEQRLNSLDLTAHAASIAAQRPDAIRNLQRAVKNKDRRGITTDTLVALAPVLKTTAAWLLEGTGEQAQDQLVAGNSVAVAGQIIAGAEIKPDFELVPPEGLYEIELPFPVPAAAAAFQIEGDSMWPRYDRGDVVICLQQGNSIEEAVGLEAAVRTSDGKRYLKRIQRGAVPGTFDLESHNGAPIRGVSIVWAAAIQAVVRSGQWRRK